MLHRLWIFSAAVGLCVPGAPAQDRPPSAPVAPAQAQGESSAQLPPARRAPIRLALRQAPGVFPVYDMDGMWILLDRRKEGPRRGLGPKRRVLVIGSSGVEVLSILHATRTWNASCSQAGQQATPGYVLGGKGRGQLGVPIIALVPKSPVQPRRARVRRLGNETSDSTYMELGPAIRKTVAREISQGRFALEAGDSLGEAFSRNPDPEKIQLRIDFAAKFPVAGFGSPQLVVAGTQISRSFRRCLRLSDGPRMVGGCALMPHALMADTDFLEFAAYDPAGGTSAPILLAYSSREPLWGHERWGFRMGRKGPSLFLLDALDPRCRQRL
ncbi:MAG: hypothetical protein HY551_06490 [Elusimicrobia bacterium]|nr:hypothetical protein [Elusimicrobiota bacterium]